MLQLGLASSLDTDDLNFQKGCMLEKLNKKCSIPTSHFLSMTYFRGYYKINPTELKITNQT